MSTLISGLTSNSASKIKYAKHAKDVSICKCLSARVKYKVAYKLDRQGDEGTFADHRSPVNFYDTLLNTLGSAFFFTVPDARLQWRALLESMFRP